MLSYNWDNQELVKKVHDYLTQKNVSVWMDIEDGVQGDLIKAMGDGVQGTTIIICFCTEKYQNSQNCQAELKYAFELKKTIIPVICDTGYTGRQTGDADFCYDPAKWPCNWLGVIIAGLTYIDFRKEDVHEKKLEELWKQIQRERSRIDPRLLMCKAPKGLSTNRKSLSLSDLKKTDFQLFYIFIIDNKRKYYGECQETFNRSRRDRDSGHHGGGPRILF